MTAIGIIIVLMITIANTSIVTTGSNKGNNQISPACTDIKLVAGCSVEDCIKVYNPGVTGLFRVEYQILPDGDGIMITIPKQIKISGHSTVKLCFTVNTSMLLMPGSYRIKITLYRIDKPCGNAMVKAWHATFIQHFRQAYFKVKITDANPNMNGVYNGWCIDLDTTMHDGSKYSASMSTAYSKLANPDNLDLVNYILNQHYIGKRSACFGTYTYGDVQRAIWSLIENHQSAPTYLRSWKQCRVNEIILDARSHGEGFIPKTGQIVGVILLPCDLSKAQICIIEVPFGKYISTP